MMAPSRKGVPFHQGAPRGYPQIDQRKPLSVSLGDTTNFSSETVLSSLSELSSAVPVFQPGLPWRLGQEAAFDPSKLPHLVYFPSARQIGRVRC